MAEFASQPDSDSAATTRRVRRDAQAAVARQDLLPGDVAWTSGRAQSRGRAASVFTDTAIDRYAFYFFMSSVGLGVLAMLGLALGM